MYIWGYVLRLVLFVVTALAAVISRGLRRTGDRKGLPYSTKSEKMFDKIEHCPFYGTVICV